MKISYVTTYDSSDINKWSGTGYYLSRALSQQNAELDLIRSLPPEPGFYIKAKSKFYSVLGQKFFKDRTLSVAKSLARQVDEAVRSDADIIFSPGSVPIAFAKTKKPKVFYTDATFAGMLNFYEGFTKVCYEAIKAGNIIEQQALTNCDLAIYTSEWAARTAQDFYKVPAKKIKVVPFGANIECSRTKEDIKKIIGARSKTNCRLLFLGVEWERKGGPLVLEIVDQLNRSGVKAELHIAGIREMPIDPLPSFVVNHGFLDKKTSEGKQKIDELLCGSHFLVVPSKAEAFGIVFCEASSFGVPSISRAVGGITTAIWDDINGKTFPLKADAKQYAEYIQTIFLNYSAYEQLAYSSFDDYQKRLNWEVSGKTIMNLLSQL